MVTVRMSEKEAKRAGLVAPKSKSTRRAAPHAGAISRCCSCKTEFTTIAAENRHVEETKHARYETVIDAEHS